jgi:hypothetical protein
MPSIPTDALPTAAFLIRHLYRPVDLGEPARLFALAETERPSAGDVWFWTDDNAKALELLSRPEVWRRYPGETEEILRFVRAMCKGLFIFRRVSVPRLEATGRTGGIEAFCHSLMHVRCDLPHGLVTAGLRFHDGRTADNVFLTGNSVFFSHRGRRFQLDVEDAITEFGAAEENGVLTLRHSSELYFKPRWKPRRLGRILYTYTVDAHSLPIGVEAVLEVDPSADVADVVLTIGHDYLSHGLNGVYYTRVAAQLPGGSAVHFTAGEPGHGFVAAAGSPYYAIIQPEIAGLALAIHTVPRQPERLVGLNTWVKETGGLHLVRARYRFDGDCRGARLVAAEDKVLTAGGFYDRTADYAEIVRNAVRTKATRGNPLDLSISYDYGAEINAFAKCFAVCAAGEIVPTSPSLPDELHGLFDRYLEHYFEVFIAGHQQRKNTIISRQLAFVILGTVTMHRATGDDRYRREIGRLCEALLDFEIRYDDMTGTPAGGFAYGIATQRAAYVDGHSASLLALTQAWRSIDDPRFAAAIDRGLASYCLETCRINADPPRKVDTISTITIDGNGTRHSENAFWNFNVGMALRFFAALRKARDPALNAIAAKHADRMELLEMVMRRQIEHSIVERDGCVELAVAPGGGETNSETQPWVALGLFGHPCD